MKFSCLKCGDLWRFVVKYLYADTFCVGLDESRERVMLTTPGAGKRWENLILLLFASGKLLSRLSCSQATLSLRLRATFALSAPVALCNWRFFLLGGHMQQRGIRLNEDQSTKLERLANTVGVSKNRMICMLIERANLISLPSVVVNLEFHGDSAQFSQDHSAITITP